MSGELARQVVEEEFGSPIGRLFVEWDPEPIASASIGQVHRAIIVDPATQEQRAVAVKVQYPGVADAIASDLKNADLLGAVLSFGFKSFEPDDMVAEIKERLSEELDYTLEAKNQQAFADFYRDHPFVHVPEVFPHLSSSRVLTTELVTGQSWAELLASPQRVRDNAAEAIFRYVFRSLYRFRAFNGDPHPGNYVFHLEDPDNIRISFLDYGLVKHFTQDEMNVFQNMISAAAIRHDYPAFRKVIEDAGLLNPDAPVDTADVGDYFSHFYAPVSESHLMHWTPEYSSSIVRHTFDRTSPIANYASVPRTFVFIQRINLGLYALLGELHAQGNYRRIAEELWPMVNAAPSTPMGEEEAAWLASRA
jgi:predicted unusual protein kinase regulating ubiquinone biosynthesis (AarF/ABC1/UbiB family)